MAGVSLPYEDFSAETYKRRLAKWRAEVLYGSPPVDHLDPIPQHPAKQEPHHAAERKSKPKAEPVVRAKRGTDTSTADLFGA